MSAIPGNLETDQQPPMTVPLRHFFVAFAFLLAGLGAGIGLVLEAIPGNGRLAHVHLLLAGWVCITIMGAMTQFVPVWSGTDLYSQRLSKIQLGLVTIGLGGFASALLLGELSWLIGFGTIMLVGFWAFVYNIGRTLTTVQEFDVTEQHFLLALLFFLALTILGVVLAANFTSPVLSSLPITHGNVVGAHVTLAVFGAVLTTIYGALYQLGTMFTQTELHGIDHYLQSVEQIGHPVGVVLLATGRFIDVLLVARSGVILILVAAVAFAIILGRKLSEMQVAWTPMHSRYTVVAAALAAWALLSIPAWVEQPLVRTQLLGAEGSVHLLVLGVIGFVILGTLYHIVPFIIWVHQYSDLLGFEEVPMIDDLYDDRLAKTDFVLLFGGTTLIVVSEWLKLDSVLVGVGGTFVTCGIAVFLLNMFLVIRNHSPDSVDVIVLGTYTPRRLQREDGPSSPDQ